jgi:sulfur carrier protein
MRLTINGESREFPALSTAATVAILVEQLALNGKRIAVERNGEVVPKSQHAAVSLADGDRFEIIVAVGGG